MYEVCYDFETIQYKQFHVVGWNKRLAYFAIFRYCWTVEIGFLIDGLRSGLGWMFIFVLCDESFKICKYLSRNIFINDLFVLIVSYFIMFILYLINLFYYISCSRMVSKVLFVPLCYLGHEFIECYLGTFNVIVTVISWWIFEMFY